MSAPAPFGSILVPVDFSPASLRALDVALALRPEDGEVTVLHVIDTDLATRVWLPETEEEKEDRV